MSITLNVLIGFMVGIGYNIANNQIDLFLGIVGITFSWD